MLHAIIMAGGSGTRLWPESRKHFPKQFLSLEGDRSFLQRTVDRLADVVPAENIRVVCGEAQAPLAREQLGSLIGSRRPPGGGELPNDSAILIEPLAKNTAACIAYAACHILLQDPDAVMIVVPADHVISPDSKFHEAIRLAASIVEDHPEKLVTFGIQPTYPAESFGYIERGESIPLLRRSGGAADGVVGDAVFSVKRFREKPSQETAQEYLDSGRFFWNAGIFVWRAAAILECLKTYAPGVYLPMREIYTALKETTAGNVAQRSDRIAAENCLEELSGHCADASFPAVVLKNFAVVESISIDYAVMEPAAAEGKVLVIAAPFAWDDVGSWRAVERIFPKDEHGNTVLNTGTGADSPIPVFIDTHASIFRSTDPQKKVIACVGVKDLGVIITPETVLIFDKYQEESVREVTKKLKEMGCEEYL